MVVDGTGRSGVDEPLRSQSLLFPPADHDICSFDLAGWSSSIPPPLHWRVHASFPIRNTGRSLLEGSNPQPSYHGCEARSRILHCCRFIFQPIGFGMFGNIVIPPGGSGKWPPALSGRDFPAPLIVTSTGMFVHRQVAAKQAASHLIPNLLRWMVSARRVIPHFSHRPPGEPA